MKTKSFTAALLCMATVAQAQERVATNPLFIAPKADVTIPYSYDGAGTIQYIQWGFDAAWENEQNLRKGLNHCGKSLVDLVRVSFRASGELVNGSTLTDDMIKHVNERCRLADFVGKKIPIAINSDQEAGISDYYKGKPENWVKTIKAHAEAFVAKGHPIVTISPFNEPDYANWNQGSMQDMKEICRLLKKDSYFDGVRLSGGNTLNCDRASEWYNYMKEYLDEGNTHQLAGDFNHYADFFAEVAADGKHPTADELHNIMEAFVGAEYGMKTGIWWGSAERARGELMKAMRGGERLGYGESRGTWMAGAVYRQPDGKVQAFIGQSERQANTTSFAFRSDRNVWYEGVGPMREYYVNVSSGKPGDYQHPERQHNGERVYDLHVGEDIPPVIDGVYYLVNRSNGHYLLEAENNNSGQQLRVRTYTGKTSQQWELHQLPETIGGDYSYHSILHVASGKAPDVENWSLNDKARIMLWDSALGGNQVYHLEYAGDGYFRLINKESNYCLQPAQTGNGQYVIQSTYKSSSQLQQWRLVPVGTKPEFVAPTAPADLHASAQCASIRLDWDAVEGDATLAGYNLLRSTSEEDGFELIARNLTATSFVDHDVVAGHTYYYKVKATDTSFNTSEASEVICGQTETNECLLAAWSFDATDSLYDATENCNNVATIIQPKFSQGKVSNSLYFNGTTQFAQLPHHIATHQALTFCAWVKWNVGGSSWQRIFDFGNDTDHYMFLTPSNGSNMMFGIKNGGEEERLTCPKLPSGKWVHVALTMDDTGVTIYLDGAIIASSSTIGLRPHDIAPTYNYLGRSQFSNDPIFKGYLDDVRLYNYALSPAQVSAIANLADGIESISIKNKHNTIYDLNGRRIATPRPGQIIIQNGNKYKK